MQPQTPQLCLTPEEQCRLRVDAAEIKPTGVKAAAFGISIIAMIVTAIPVFWMIFEDLTLTGTTNPDPAFYRGTLLIPNSMFILSIWAVYADQELFDFDWAILLGFVALVFNFVLVLAEVLRWVDCNSLPVINFTICQQFPTTNSVLPIIAILLLLLNIAGVIALEVWRRHYEMWDVADARSGMRNVPRIIDPAEEAVQLKQEADEAQTDPVLPDAKTLALRKTLHSWLDTTLAILGSLNAVVLFLTSIVALRYIDSVAFYRGIYLLVPALYGGAEIAFWMTVKASWRWAYLIFAIIGLIIAIIGIAYDYPRYTACLTTPPTPKNAVDASICADDAGWRLWVVPMALLIVILLLVISIVLMIVRIATDTKAFEKYLRRRRAEQLAKQQAAQAAAAAKKSNARYIGSQFAPPTPSPSSHDGKHKKARD
jgi:hypothetical protein